MVQSVALSKAHARAGFFKSEICESFLLNKLWLMSEGMPQFRTYCFFGELHGAHDL
jgi:hypothetical protein